MEEGGAGRGTEEAADRGFLDMIPTAVISGLAIWRLSRQKEREENVEK